LNLALAGERGESGTNRRKTLEQLTLKVSHADSPMDCCPRKFLDFLIVWGGSQLQTSPLPEMLISALRGSDQSHMRSLKYHTDGYFFAP
jgi:hypothetical protein